MKRLMKRRRTSGRRWVASGADERMQMEESLVGGRRSIRRKMRLEGDNDRFRFVEVTDFGWREPS